MNAGALIGGKYRLLRPCGRGGMGCVWVARHVELDVDVAVKLISPELADTPQALARFEREAKLAARLRSSHVPQVHDYGIAGGIPYIAMELLDGESLDAVLATEAPLSLARTALIVTQAAEALEVAHEAGLVHRDIKPANIFLCRGSPAPVVKVLDFGIAKETALAGSVDLTSSATLVGTPRYMSPEQIRGGAVDRRTDLWSLAAVAFEALVGRLAFDGTTLGDVLGSILVDELPMPSQASPELPHALDGFFQRAWARDPAKRFSSACELAARLGVIAEAFPEAVAASRALPILSPGEPSALDLANPAPARESVPAATDAREPGVAGAVSSSAAITPTDTGLTRVAGREGSTGHAPRAAAPAPETGVGGTEFALAAREAAEPRPIPRKRLRVGLLAALAAGAMTTTLLAVAPPGRAPSLAPAAASAEPWRDGSPSATAPGSASLAGEPPARDSVATAGSAIATHDPATRAATVPPASLTLDPSRAPPRPRTERAAPAPTRSGATPVTASISPTARPATPSPAPGESSAPSPGSGARWDDTFGLPAPRP